MSKIGLRNWGKLCISLTIRGCVTLMAASVLASCGRLAGLINDAPDFTFVGTFPRVGNPTFHRFTVGRNGDLTASIVWTSPQSHQTVCAGRSDIADQGATCAPSVAGTSNSVKVSVHAGEPWLVYGGPDFSADAPYTIEVRIR